MKHLFQALGRIRWKRWILVFTAVLALLASSFLLLIRTGWFKQKLFDRIIAQVEGMTGGSVKLAGYEFDPFDLRATLTGLTVYSSRDRSTPAFLHVPSLRVQLGITSFWRREVFLRSLRLDSPRVHIEIAEDGSSNLPSFAGDGGKPPTDELFDLAVDRVDLTEGSIEWNGEAYPVSFAAQEFSLQTRFEPNLGRYRAWVHLGESKIDFAAHRPLLTEAEVELFLYRDRIEASEVYLAGKGFQTSGRLRAAPLVKPAITLDYQATLQLPALSSWLGGVVMESGEAEIAGKGRWEPSANVLSYEGQLTGKSLAFQASRLKSPSIDATARYSGNREQLTLTDLHATALGGAFTGEAELDGLSVTAAPHVRVRGDFDGFPLQGLLTVVEPAHPNVKDLPWSSVLRGWLRAEGTGAADLEADVSLIFTKPDAVEPPRIPLEGIANVSYHAASRTVHVPRLELTTSGTKLWAQGAVTPQGRAALRVRAETERTGDLLAAAKSLGLAESTTQASDFAFLVRGPARFEGNLQGDLVASPPEIELAGRIEAADLHTHGYDWDRFTGEITYSPSKIEVTRGRLERNSAFVEVDASIERTGKPIPESPLQGDVRFGRLPVADLLKAAGRGEPLTGTMGGSAHVAGSMSHPEGTATFEVTGGTAWRQPFDRLQAAVRFDKEKQIVDSFDLTYRQARLQGRAEVEPAEERVRFEVHASQWRVQDLEAVGAERQASGEIELDLSGAGQLASGRQSFESLSASGEVRLRDLRLGDQAIGSFRGKVSTPSQAVRVDWQGTLATGTLLGGTEIRPGDQNPVTGEFRWSKVDVNDLAALASLPLENVKGETDGSFTFVGPLSDLAQWRAQGEVTRLEVSYSQVPGASRGYSLWNPFPMRWSVANRSLRLESMRLLGEGTDILVDGTVGLQEGQSLDVSTKGTFNLAVLEGFNSGLQARGSSVVEMTARGPFKEPRVRGRMEIRNASLRHQDFSNGLSQINGVLRFNDRQINIEQLTAASGGGNLTLQGTAEHEQDHWNYRLDAEVDRVRFRYPEAVSSVIAGRLAVSGTSLRSLLSGDLVVSQVTIGSQLELGTILASLAEPRQTLPSNPALNNMQLNVSIDSVPDLRVETALVRNAAANLDLRLAGTALNPALLGDIAVTQGQLEFQGTRFDINRGDISFVNPFRIDPVIDFELETRVRDIDIALTLSGPARKINVTPRSDPPLPFSELITLLALGRTPTTDPVLAARQTIAQQSLTQTGANTILSQAMSQPVNRRLQRFFGVSRLKIDPQAGGAEANPSARISTEQQITNQLTFTYSYDLSSAQQQVVRIDWTPTRQWSFIVTRDENGLVGADVLFKKRLR